MATVIQPAVKKDLLRYGAAGMDLCFNCGTCTAVCPLSLAGASFPRKLVRYAQLGLKDRLASAPEPWLCYACGECTATCPKEATPGDTMAALRRHAIAAYDPTGLAGLMFRSPAFAVFFTVALGVLLGFFHLSIQAGKYATEPAHWAVFSWIPYGVVHTLGMAVGGLMMLGVLAALFNAARLMLKPHGGLAGLRRHSWADFLRALSAVGREIATMKRHAECRADAERGEPWYLQPRFAHGTILAGFAMLLVATSLDFLFVFFLKMEFYGVARPLGILGGMVMLYGLAVYTAKRWKGASPGTRTTTLSDAWLLFFLLVLDLTGFALLLIVTFGWKGAAGDVILLVHSAMAMEFVLLFGATKIGHALYRPLALFFHFLKQPQPQA